MKTRIPTLAFAAVLSAGIAARAADVRLVEAASSSDRAAVQALIAQKADVNAAQNDGMTALHWAATKDDLQMAKMLLAAHANVAPTTRLGAVTPVFMAATNGSAPMIAELLRSGADANSTKATGTTVLMIAAQAGNVEAVRLLVQHGADINRKEGARDETALMFAAAAGRAEVIRFLVSKGARLDTQDRVVQLARTKYGDITEDPTEKPKTGPDGKPAAAAEAAPEDRVQGASVTGGMTALLFAAREGHMNAVRSLAESGANLNIPTGGEKISPLLMAIINGHYDIGKYLLDKGADPNLAAINGLRPLYATVDVQWAPLGWFPNPITAQEQVGYLDLMKAILDKGGDVNARLTDSLWFRPLTHNGSRTKFPGATAFWRAAQANDVAAMRLLGQHHADPKLANVDGDSPLMVAAGVGWRGNYSVTAPDSILQAVQYCLELGVDVNGVDRNGFTALHGAAYRGSNDTVQFLFDHGGKIDARTRTGDSVADMANGPERFGTLHPETTQLAIKLGSPFSDNCRSAQCLPPPKSVKTAR